MTSLPIFKEVIVVLRVLCLVVGLSFSLVWQCSSYHYLPWVSFVISKSDYLQIFWHKVF